MDRTIIIGSRGSKLALWQAEYAKRKLADKGVNAEIKIIKTQGDKIQHLSFDKMEGKGFFTKELEEALLDKKIDLAVHSHKDLQTVSPKGLIIAGVSERANPSELLLIRKDAFKKDATLWLKDNAIVGTSAPRRKSQLLFFRNDLEIRDLRGNVQTRMQKLTDGKYDAILLAAAGLERLGITPETLIVKQLDPEYFIPAPAQGVLAYQIREEDLELQHFIQQIEDKASALITKLERELLKSIEGGCQIPAGIYCKSENNRYHLWSSLSNDAETTPKRIYLNFNDTSEFNADTITKQLKSKSRGKIFISRKLEKSSLFKKITEYNGYQITDKSFVDFSPIQFSLDNIECDWMFFTSKRAVDYFFKNPASQIFVKNKKIAAIGKSTALRIENEGHDVDFIGTQIRNTDIAESFEEKNRGEIILFPGAVNRSSKIIQLLHNSNDCKLLNIYENEPIEDPENMEDMDVLVFTSSLNARTYFKKHKAANHQKIVAIGKPTANTIEGFDVKVNAVAAVHTELALADALFSLELQN
ncbi:MAG: hydroxymethylbilane synthase [Chitinophagaceae bacterium]|nr:MAG: hydroxymethylbilane synthase [Chitinophagaceae bacterium]